MIFECEKCGCCCQNLHLSSLYDYLHNGDGVCRHYDSITKLCKIYESRDIWCNIDAIYDFYYSKIMKREDYYTKNKEVCVFFRKRG